MFIELLFIVTNASYNQLSKRTLASSDPCSLSISASWYCEVSKFLGNKLPLCVPMWPRHNGVNIAWPRKVKTNLPPCKLSQVPCASVISWLSDYFLFEALENNLLAHSRSAIIQIFNVFIVFQITWKLLGLRYSIFHVLLNVYDKIISLSSKNYPAVPDLSCMSEAN